MSRSTVKVTINDRVIQDHFAAGGIVYDEMRDIGRRAVVLAKVYAPIRTGELKKSIGGGNVARTGLYGDYMTIYSTAAYALFVEKGTEPISARNGGWLRLPRTRGAVLPRSAKREVAGKKTFSGFGAFLFKRVVAGQRAQRFLARGVQDTMRAKGYSISL